MARSRRREGAYWQLAIQWEQRRLKPRIRVASTFSEERQQHHQANKHSKRPPHPISQLAGKDSTQRCSRKQTQRRETGPILFTSSSRPRQLSSSAKAFRFGKMCKEADLGCSSNSGRHSLVQHLPSLIRVVLLRGMMLARKYMKYSGESSPIKDGNFSTICSCKKRLQQRWRVTPPNDDYLYLLLNKT